MEFKGQPTWASHALVLLVLLLLMLLMLLLLLLQVHPTL
jgi:hypothetical protein